MFAIPADNPGINATQFQIGLRSTDMNTYGPQRIPIRCLASPQVFLAEFEGNVSLRPWRRSLCHSVASYRVMLLKSGNMNDWCVCICMMLAANGVAEICWLDLRTRVYLVFWLHCSWIIGWSNTVYEGPRLWTENTLHADYTLSRARIPLLPVSSALAFTCVSLYHTRCWKPPYPVSSGMPLTLYRILPTRASSKHRYGLERELISFVNIKPALQLLWIVSSATPALRGVSASWMHELIGFQMTAIYVSIICWLSIHIDCLMMLLKANLCLKHLIRVLNL